MKDFRYKSLAEIVIRDLLSQGSSIDPDYWKKSTVIHTLAQPFQLAKNHLPVDQYNEIYKRGILSTDINRKSLSPLLIAFNMLILGSEGATFAAFFAATLLGEVITPKILIWFIVIFVLGLGIALFKAIRWAATESLVAKHKDIVRKKMAGTSDEQEEAKAAASLMLNYYSSPTQPHKKVARISMVVFLVLFFGLAALLRGFTLQKGSNEPTTVSMFSATNSAAYDPNLVVLPDDNEQVIDSGSMGSPQQKFTNFSPVLASFCLAGLVMLTSAMVYHDLKLRIKLVISEQEWLLLQKHKSEDLLLAAHTKNLNFRQKAFSNALVDFGHYLNHFATKDSAAYGLRIPPISITPSDFIKE